MGGMGRVRRRPAAPCRARSRGARSPRRASGCSARRGHRSLGRGVLGRRGGGGPSQQAPPPRQTGRCRRDRSVIERGPAPPAEPTIRRILESAVPTRDAAGDRGGRRRRGTDGLGDLVDDPRGLGQDRSGSAGRGRRRWKTSVAAHRSGLSGGRRHGRRHGQARGYRSAAQPTGTTRSRRTSRGWSWWRRPGGRYAGWGRPARGQTDRGRGWWGRSPGGVDTFTFPLQERPAPTAERGVVLVVGAAFLADDHSKTSIVDTLGLRSTRW